MILASLNMHKMRCSRTEPLIVARSHFGTSSAPNLTRKFSNYGMNFSFGAVERFDAEIIILCKCSVFAVWCLWPRDGEMRENHLACSLHRLPCISASIWQRCSDHSMLLAAYKWRWTKCGKRCFERWPLDGSSQPLWSTMVRRVNAEKDLKTKMKWKWCLNGLLNICGAQTHLKCIQLLTVAFLSDTDVSGRRRLI